MLNLLAAGLPILTTFAEDYHPSDPVWQDPTIRDVEHPQMSHEIYRPAMQHLIILAIFDDEQLW